MAPKRTPNPAAAARRDIDALITAVLDKVETDDPAWAVGLAAALKDARGRAAARAGRPPAPEPAP